MQSVILASLHLLAMASPPIDAVRQSLSAHSDGMFFWLVVSSIVTGIGVIFEVPGELHELKRWRKLKRLKKPVGWKVPIAFFGLVLVIGGIVGEGIFELLSSNAETAIRAHDETVLGSTIEEAGDAKKSAESAAAALGKAQKSLARVKSEEDALSKKAGHIDTELAFAQRMLGARHVLNESDLESNLAKEFKGKVIVFMSYALDPEAFMLCKQLVSTATRPQAGVLAKDECADEPLPSHLQVSELKITAPTIDEAERLSMVIGRAGGIIGLYVNLGQTPDITVLVGKRASQPLFWPKSAQGNNKLKKHTKP